MAKYLGREEILIFTQAMQYFWEGNQSDLVKIIGQLTSYLPFSKEKLNCTMPYTQQKEKLFLHSNLFPF